MDLNQSLKDIRLAIVLMVLVLAGMVNAYDTNLTFRNYNTLGDVENASVSVYEDVTLTDSGYTDMNGEIYFNLSDGSYTILATHDDYETLNEDLIISGETEQVFYMIPYSPEGIIRLRFTDLTIGGLSLSGMETHTICVFYHSNNRLHECYDTNDTITLNQNVDYDFFIMPSRVDLLTQSGNLDTVVSRYAVFLIGLMLLLIIIGVGYYGIKNKLR